MGEVESFAVELVEPALFVDDEVVLEFPSGEDVAAALEVVWFDDPGMVALIRAAVQRGVTLFDTAEVVRPVHERGARRRSALSRSATRSVYPATPSATSRTRVGPSFRTPRVGFPAERRLATTDLPGFDDEGGLMPDVPPRGRLPWLRDRSEVRPGMHPCGQD